MNDEEFWMVFNPNGPRGGVPTCRHDSERSATNEAERLARLHPGEAFYVLRATHMRVCCTEFLPPTPSDAEVRQQMEAAGQMRLIA